MSEVIHNIKIPKNVLDKLKPCWKHNEKPIVQSISESFPDFPLFYEIRIRCPDKKCNNFIDFSNYAFLVEANDKEIKEWMIQKWNDKNIEKFIPKSKLKELKHNCNNCKYVKNCIYTREEYISDFFNLHICDDFEKKNKE